MRPCPDTGYGDVSPNNCWLANWIIVVQSIFALLLNAVVMGVIFARISRPSQRGRTIFLSDSAVIARRDGILHFMFRCTDIRPTNTVWSVINNTNIPGPLPPSANNSVIRCSDLQTPNHEPSCLP